MWNTSQRRADLPEDWDEIRGQVLRDHPTCQHAGCSSPSTDVDHRQRGNDHSRGNLQALCSWHHARKSSREGHEQRAKLKALRKRPPERHPGSR